MIYELFTRDPIWKDALLGLILCAVLCAVPPIGGFDVAALYGPLFVMMTLFLAMPHRRATHFEAALPIAARDLFLARALCMVASVWLMAIVAITSVAISSGNAKAAWKTIVAASVCTLGAGFLQSIRARQLAAPKWTVIALFFLVLSANSYTAARQVSGVVPALCVLLGVALLVRTWSAVPKSFQVAPEKPAVDRMTSKLLAGVPSPRPAWLPVLRSVFSIPYSMMIVWTAFAVFAGQWTASSFSIAVAWLAARRSTSWLRVVPVRPRALLFTVISPLLLTSAVAYFAGFYFGRHPRPASDPGLWVFELCALLAWQTAVALACALVDWRRLRHIPHTVRIAAIFFGMAVLTIGSSWGYLQHHVDLIRAAVLHLAQGSGNIAVLAVVAVATAAVLWFSMEKLFAEAEYADKPCPAAPGYFE